MLLLGLGGEHVDLTAHVFCLFLLDPVHTFHADMGWLDVRVGPVVDGLVACDFALHGGSQTALGTLWPVILHLLELVLAGELVEVAVRVTDLVTVRSITGYSV